MRVFAPEKMDRKSGVNIFRVGRGKVAAGGALSVPLVDELTSNRSDK